MKPEELMLTDEEIVSLIANKQMKTGELLTLDERWDIIKEAQVRKVLTELNNLAEYWEKAEKVAFDIDIWNEVLDYFGVKR